MASREPSWKQGREEVPQPPPAEPKEVKPPHRPSPRRCRRPARRARGGEATPPEEVPPPTPTEVKPPPHKEVKPPRCKVALQPVEVVHAHALSVEDASWSTKLFHEASMKLRKMVVHLGVQPPSHLLQTTVKDCAFMIKDWLGTWREECSPPSTTTAVTMAASTSPAPALAPAPTPTVGLLRQRLPLLN
jgi:hypothetical protein